jgi:sigma-B regulation protein RsbU (phosphoserine phosphatase)
VAAAAVGVIGARTPDSLRDVLEEACRRVIPFDSFFLQLYDPETRTFRGIGGYDAGIYSPPDITLADGTPGGHVVGRRRSLVTHSSTDPKSRGGQLTGTGRRSESTIRSPILSGDDVLGILSLQSYTPGLYSEEDVEVIEVIASLAATALVNLRSEATYRTIFELASDAIFVHDLKTGAILDANIRACELHGVTLAELKEIGIGGISDGTPPFTIEEAEARLRQAAAWEPQRFEWLVKKKTGERFWVEVSLHRVGILGEDRILASVRNISERKAAEEMLKQIQVELERRVEERTAELSERTAELERRRAELMQAEQRFRAIVEASPTPLLLSKVEDGTILFANDRVEEMIEVEPGSLIGKRTIDFYYDPSDRPRVIEIAQRQGYVRDLELRIRRADGTPLWVSLSIQRLVIDGEPTVATSLLDITERIEAEAARAVYARSLEQELEIGREIQRGFFPLSIPQPAGWEIAARFHPARQVSGDFYDVFGLTGGRIGLAMADVCGKGVGAALFMALVRSLIRAYADRASLSPSSPGLAILLEAVTATNRYLTRVHRSAHTFSSLFFGVLDPPTGLLQYVNAGHLPPIVTGPNGTRKFPPTGPALGLLASASFEVRQTILEPGDVLLAYTDGVTEARDAERDFFGDDRLDALLAPADTAACLLDRIERSVHEFTGDLPPSDDLTLLAVRRE